jgi:hypothetical protein
MVAVTLGLAPAESECFGLRAMVRYQSGRRIALTCKEAPELWMKQAALARLLAAIAW